MAFVTSRQLLSDAQKEGYAVGAFNVENMEMVQAVAAAWQEIWKLDLPRTFQYDFEEYQNDSMDQAEIHIYVGLKNLSNNG